MSSVKHRIDLSDEAFNGLRTMARSANFLQVAPFLMACAHEHVIWYDARPDSLLTMPVEAGQAAVWYDGSKRWGRSFGELPASYLISIALSHHIRAHSRQAVTLQGLDPIRRIRTMHKTETTWQLLNAVLEAIGLAYLRPVGLLPYKFLSKSRKSTLDKRALSM